LEFHQKQGWSDMRPPKASGGITRHNAKSLWWISTTGSFVYNRKTQHRMIGERIRIMEKTGAQIVIETLLEQGVTTLFGYPGGQIMPVYDELYKYADRIRHVLTCHEQGAAHAADGYARATGKTGVVLATSGPGATNLVTGIATAYMDSSPMVAITGNVPLALIGSDSFQEVDIQGISMPITKHNYIVKSVEELADTLREAFEIASSGLPGPVLVDIPKNVQLAHCEFDTQPPKKHAPGPCPEEKDLQAALAMIQEARRPFIYAGGGVVIANASAELDTFSRLIDAPVGLSIMGLSAMPRSNPRCLGMTGMHGMPVANLAMNDADLIIAVGARFSDRATGDKSKFIPRAKVLHLDIDPAEIDKNIPASLSVLGDIGQLLNAFNARLLPRKNEQWWERIDSLARPAASEAGDVLTPRAVIEAAAALAPDGCLIATDVGQHQMWAAQFYPVTHPRSFITSGGLGTMGFGMGAAIGASMAAGAPVTLFTGDGSFHMNLNELATAVSYQIPLTVIVLNNQVLGMVRQWQTLFFDKRYASTDPMRKTDFALLARAFGARGYRADSPKALREALTQAWNGTGPCVIDCAIGKDEMVLPMIPPGGSVENMILK
jgi:acetolactate synthase-1/2/3 large subunit